MSELRRGAEQAQEEDVQANTLMNMDTTSSPLPSDDPILEMALLVELYIQDLTLLGLFCQYIARYSYRVLYFSPELVCKKDTNASSTSTAIRQLLNTAADLSAEQLAEYTSALSLELHGHREKNR